MTFLQTAAPSLCFWASKCLGWPRHSERPLKRSCTSCIELYEVNIQLAGLPKHVIPLSFKSSYTLSLNDYYFYYIFCMMIMIMIIMMMMIMMMMLTIILVVVIVVKRRKMTLKAASAVNFILCSFALAFVFTFEHTFNEYLHRIGPFWKFWGVKGVVRPGTCN